MSQEFTYTHHDGRSGEGWSSWAAIVAAIGPAEAQPLELREVTWTDGYPRTATVETESGIEIGTLTRQ